MSSKYDSYEVAMEPTKQIQGKVTFLMGAYEKLCDDAKLKDDRFDSLDTKLSSMDSKLDSVLTALGKQPVRDRSPIHTPLRDPVLSSTRSRVQSSHFERVRAHSPLGYCDDRLNLDNRENMLKKIEMPSCDGSRVSEWMVDVEYFYELGRYDEDERLELVPLCLRGALKKWFAWVMRRGCFRSWKDFKQRLFVRFSESIEDEPSTRLFSIRQTGSVAEYVSEFEDLSAEVTGLDDHHLERIFYIGLNREMKEVIRMKEPQGLANYIAAVLKMESSTFCRVVSDGSKGGARQLQTGVNNNVRNGGYYNNTQKLIRPKREGWLWPDV